MQAFGWDSFFKNVEFILGKKEIIIHCDAHKSLNFSPTLFCNERREIIILLDHSNCSKDTLIKQGVDSRRRREQVQNVPIQYKISLH